MKEYLEIPEYEKNLPISYYHQEGHILTSPHWHKALEFYYVLQGVLTIGVEDEIIHISEGETYIISSGLTHYVLSSPGSERYVFLVEPTIFNEGEKSDPLMEPIRDIFKKIEPHSVNWPEKTQNKVGALLQKLHKELKLKNKAYKYQIHAIVNEILTLCVREIPQAKSKENITISLKNQETIEKLNTVYDYIDKHYKQDISLEQIAATVGYSPSYFARFFKKNTGQTFVEFLNEFRISKAKWFLTTGTKQISDIASESGFNSRKTFHHVFKERTNMSPLEYRELMQKKSQER